MDVEEELLSFLNNLPQRVGQPRMDGSPRKMAELNPVLRKRNHEVILGYYGFGAADEFWPTYEELGQYDNLTRERIRQLIDQNCSWGGPLPVASKWQTCSPQGSCGPNGSF
jgi:hypothetical protein